MQKGEAEERRHEAKSQRQHELEMARLKLEHGETDSSRERLTSSSSGSSDRRIPQLNMPMFNKTQEAIDTYLQHFERSPRIHGVCEDHWATVVLASLQGNAKAVYSSLDLSVNVKTTEN